MIRKFGAPNGLCSSITESKHIKAVKKPWRRSSRNKPLGQMLTTNDRLDKLAAARLDFNKRGLLDAPRLVLDGGVTAPEPEQESEEDEADSAAVNDHRAIAEVTLSKTHGEYFDLALFLAYLFTFSAQSSPSNIRTS
jgi:hypothetical protein